MSELEAVRDIGRQALTVSGPMGGFATCLWDRAERLVSTVEYIFGLPELVRGGLQIDRFCLIAATYFSESGLARCLASGEREAAEVLSNANSEELLDLSARVVEERLAGVVEKARIDKINRIIVESGGRFTKMAEAMILSDARNLDDMGTAGIFNEFGRYFIGGKGVRDVLQSWKKKKDYRYWQARLKEGFRFEQVRRLAEQRLSTAEFLMKQLEAETEAQDLEEVSVKSALS
ncbi:MAG: hypothetical protein ACYSTJ_00045 [Planctomycetota bacterium]|jgi:hypothetical protein